jgi:hypothetical protein
MSAHTDTSARPKHQRRGELRLTLVTPSDEQTLDGGWWPYSRDLTREMVELAQNFPRERGRIVRAACCSTDWDGAPQRVTAGPDVIKLGPSLGDEPHEITLETAHHGTLTLLVIPPGFTTYQGSEALLAAATPGNRHRGVEVLLEVTNQHDADPAERWPVVEDEPSQGVTSGG